MSNLVCYVQERYLIQTVWVTPFNWYLLYQDTNTEHGQWHNLNVSYHITNAKQLNGQHTELADVAINPSLLYVDR